MFKHSVAFICEYSQFLAEMARIGAYLLYSFLFFRTFCSCTSDFLGNYVSDEEYENRTLCWSPACIRDSDRLKSAAAYDFNKTAPCDDFKIFAIGEFFKRRTMSDKRREVFDSDVNEQFDAKQKKILLKPIEDDDPKMFKVIKSYFRQCINSGRILLFFFL